MFNPNKITKILGATFILVSSNFAMAATSPSSVTVEVRNAFVLNKSADLSFGEVRATSDPTGANIASLILAPDGTLSAGAAIVGGNLTALGLGAAGAFDITGAAGFTDLTIEFPADFELISTGAPPTSPTFDILQADWTATISGGANDGDAYNTVTPNLQTDTNGIVAFTVGASLKTDSDASSTPYLDAEYTANFTMEVTY